MFPIRPAQILAATTMLVALSVPAPAQTADPVPAPDSAPALDAVPTLELPAPKETIPEQIYPCNPGNYVPPPGDEPDLPPSIDCGEVIVPPAGVDPEFTEPPPDTGPDSTPVIPPGAIDPQTPVDPQTQ